jgi:hypothetical protein
MFHANARVHTLSLGAIEHLDALSGAAPNVASMKSHEISIIDNALVDPYAWIERAAEHKTAFESLPGNAYPGLEMRMPDGVSMALAEFCQQHRPASLPVSAVQGGYSRLSLVTLPGTELRARQWICHRDQLTRDPNLEIMACVLYLFDKPALGGTSFYRPKQGEWDTASMIHDSGALTDAEFAARYRIEPGYLRTSNAYFEQIATVEPVFNRLIVYSGRIFHSSHIGDETGLSADPRRGRLTLNGFFICRP